MYKIKNVRFKKVELDLRVHKYIGFFVKFLELIEEPAYLITENRLVVASNFKAQEKGVKLVIVVTKQYVRKIEFVHTVNWKKLSMKIKLLKQMHLYKVKHVLHDGLILKMD